MNRVKRLFAEKKAEQEILNVYFTAGYPALDDTMSLIANLELVGADLLEIGIPFSDPLADGATIQQASEQALNNGMGIEMLFKQLETLRDQSQIPVILMGYLNPVLQYGLEKFLERSKEVGVDGFIFPDVPSYEFTAAWKDKLEELDLCFSFLVTPETPTNRVRLLDGLSSGFLYAVSSSSTTGSATGSIGQENTKNYLQGLKSMNLVNPILAGFGISTATDFRFINSQVDGAIVGSAFIRHISKNGIGKGSIEWFVKDLKGN